ncbi:MAG: UpxY family transcription antiterminator [bacterium]|nr:UpxY family transcription antiterminator [bacterium]
MSAGQPPENSEPQWYVLRTMPQHEKKLATFFEKQGLAHYLPLVPRKRQWSDRVKIVEFPLFPGYIFVRFAWFAAYKTILGHNGSIDFVRSESVPSVMRAEEIENLSLLVGGALELEANPDEKFPPGQKVEVRSGPLKGVRGVVQRVKNKSRLFVHLPLLNQMVVAEVDVLDVEKLV